MKTETTATQTMTTAEKQQLIDLLQQYAFDCNMKLEELYKPKSTVPVQFRLAVSEHLAKTKQQVAELLVAVYDDMNHGQQ